MPKSENEEQDSNALHADLHSALGARSASRQAGEQVGDVVPWVAGEAKSAIARGNADEWISTYRYRPVRRRFWSRKWAIRPMLRPSTNRPLRTPILR